jgi:hypothetical protein
MRLSCRRLLDWLCCLAVVLSLLTQLHTCSTQLLEQLMVLLKQAARFYSQARQLQAPDCTVVFDVADLGAAAEPSSFLQRLIGICAAGPGSDLPLHIGVCGRWLVRLWLRLLRPLQVPLQRFDGTERW